MSQSPLKPGTQPHWGQPPWTIDFHPQPHPLPAEVDFAVVGGGFSGLSAAACLRRYAPDKSVVLFEAGSIGAGSSGRTGGTALAESAAGDLPGLGDVLAGYSDILKELEISADLYLPGAWELARRGGLPNSPISWEDSGTLRAVKEVPGGNVDPGKVVSGLARAAERAGVQILENSRVKDANFGDVARDFVQLDVPGRGSVRARQVLFASNAESLELTGLAGHASPTLTLAVATAPLAPAKLESLGLASGKPFYTVDFPYLWGRPLNRGVIFGSGLLNVDNWRELNELDIATGEFSKLMSRLEKRVHGLHPALNDVTFTHKWAGPMLIAENWTPAFRRHPLSDRALVLGAYSGHGVALSVYLGRWAAQVMLGTRLLPNWA